MAEPGAGRMIAVIGNGIIGHGIAETFAGAGWQVRLIGRDQRSLDGAVAKIGTSLAMFETHGLVTAAQREAALRAIATTTRLDHAAAAELVIEEGPDGKAR